MHWLNALSKAPLGLATPASPPRIHTTPLKTTRVKTTPDSSVTEPLLSRTENERTMFSIPPIPFRRLLPPVGQLRYLTCAWLCWLWAVGWVEPRWGWCGQLTTAPATSAWRLGATDTGLKESQIRRRGIVDTAAGGQGEIDEFTFDAGHGTELQLIRDLEPVRVIPDWSVVLPVKANWKGLRLQVRVVLPHAYDSITGRRLTVLLPGTATTSLAGWEQLGVGGDSSSLVADLREAIWVLRQKHGAEVSDRDAYIDQLVLNAYGGSGRHVVQLGLPRTTGSVGLDTSEQALNSRHGPHQDPALRQVALQELDDRSRARIRRDATVLELDEQPFLGRVIQHNGETFEYLRGLGFNTIQLATTATDVQVLEAEQADVWLLCPPPPDWQSNALAARSERILAWMLGEGMGEQESRNVAERIRELRAGDPRAGRPIAVGAVENWAALAQNCDLLVVGQLTAGGNLPLNRYSDWVAGCREATGNSLPVWVDLHTEFPAAAVRQMGNFIGQLPPLPLEPQQLQFALFEALAGGGRGIRFLSRSRLDGADPQSRLRALQVQWLNRQLDQFEPWVAAGVVVGSNDTGNNPLQVTALKLNRGTLLLVQQTTGWEQLVTGDAPLQTIRFTDIYSAVSDRAYLLADYGLVPLGNNRGPAGAELQIDLCPQLAAVVLTQDPQIVNRLSGGYDRPGSPGLINLHDQLTHQWFTITQLLEGQASREGRGTATASSALNEALRVLRQAESFLANGTPLTATNYLIAADQQLAVVRRELVAEARGGFRSQVSAPLLMHPSLLPAHWQLASQASRLGWEANGLGAGEFENLEQLLANGWENIRAEDPNLETLVELSPQGAVAGQTGLRLVAAAGSAPQGSASRPPLRIHSGSVRIPAGKLVRIHGWVKLPQPLRGTAEGLLIFDSLGGRDLGLRVRQTEGWQEIVMYRATAEEVDLRLTIQLQGLGEVFLDEFTVQSLDLPAPANRSAAKPTASQEFLQKTP